MTININLKLNKFVPHVLVQLSLSHQASHYIGHFQYQELSFSMNHEVEEGRIPLVYIARNLGRFPSEYFDQLDV
jgi:hypothetical protein